MTNPNESAFSWVGKEGTISDGLTKREWFAGMAMAGDMAAVNNGVITMPDDAHRWTEAADALIAELNKETP